MRWVSKAGVAALGVAIGVGSVAAPAAAQSKLSPQLAYGYGETENARSLAMGGALRALGSGTTATFLNPADIVETRMYHVEALGLLTPEATRAIGGAALAESIISSTRLAGAASITGGVVDPKGLDRTLADARLAFAYPLGDRVFIGLGGRYARFTQAGLGPFGASKVSGGLADPKSPKPIVETVTFDAGITIKASESIYLAVLGQNITHPGNGFLPTTVGGGIGYANKDLSIEADAVADFDSYSTTALRAMAGGEYLVADHYPLRLGYRFDQGANVHFLSAGVGYVGKEFSVEAAVRRSLSTTINATTVVLGLTFFLEATSIFENQVAGPE
jgi:hypothetical protein